MNEIIDIDINFIHVKPSAIPDTNKNEKLKQTIQQQMSEEFNIHKSTSETRGSITEPYNR